MPVFYYVQERLALIDENDVWDGKALGFTTSEGNIIEGRIGKESKTEWACLGVNSKKMQYTVIHNYTVHAYRPKAQMLLEWRYSKLMLSRLKTMKTPGGRSVSTIAVIALP